MSPLQLAIIPILEKADKFEWSVQGLGMLRLYIRRIGRIHIWSSALQYSGVSLIHTHSWDLESTVVCGQIRNTRYSELTTPELGERFLTKRIRCGFDTQELTEPKEVTLFAHPTEVYNAGDTYAQRAAEIHNSASDEGTVTIVRRDLDDNGCASVYWRLGQEYGNAKPRLATPEEIKLAVDAAFRALL